MFDIELFALLSEIVSGTAAATAILFAVWLTKRSPVFVVWLKKSLGQFTQVDRKKDVREYLVYPIGVALVLAMGLALQSAVDDAIDSRPIGIATVAAPIQVLLQSKDAYRFGALFVRQRNGTAKDPDEERWWDDLTFTPPISCTGRLGEKFALTRLGEEILFGQPHIVARFLPKVLSQQACSAPKVASPSDANALPQSGSVSSDCAGGSDNNDEETKRAENIELWRELLSNPKSFLLQANTEKRCRVAISVAKGVYYDGNNWAMMNEGPSRVLRRWQIQIDMLGSVAIASMFIVSLGLAYLATIAWRDRTSDRIPALLAAALASLFVFLAILAVRYVWGEPLTLESTLKSVVAALVLGALWYRSKATAWSNKKGSIIAWVQGGLVVGLMCGYGYIVASKDYTGRAIGMYLSYMARQEPQKVRADCEHLERFMSDRSYELPAACNVKIPAQSSER